MKANILKRLLVAIATAGTVGLATSAELAPTAVNLPMSNALQGSGSVSIAKPHRYADVFVEGDTFSANYTFTPQAADVGKAASLYVVARLVEPEGTKWFALNGGKWQAWSGDPATLPAAGSKVLQNSETLAPLQDQTLFAGDYRIYAGYRTQGGPLVYSQAPLSFSVAATESDTLQRFSSPEAMEAYLKEGLQKASSPEYFVTTLAFSPNFSLATAAARDMGRTSSTNLQESGVDEADSIKVEGDTLFMLASCESGACLNVQRLDSAAARAEPLTTYKFDTEHVPTGMYFVDDGILGQDMLVTTAGQNIFWSWFSIWGGWEYGKTEINFLNVANPTSISSIEKLTLDGALVASRRVGDTLYVVTRYMPRLEGYIPFPMAKTEEDKNATVLESTTLPEILPRVIDSREEVTTLVQSKDCYLSVSAVDGSINPSIITITGISLKDPTKMESTCFLGSSETLYMTTDSLYLATTSWDYDIRAMNDLRYSPEHTTAIHKFALADSGIDYRGSGTVRGHLGWHEDKKSFRMGENGAYLNVATSLGDWSATSSTRLTVLKEAGNNTLQTVSTIDGIGKPGEQLYAARFMGDRAYLVTFRVTDPLYVVDLSAQENPRMAGELSIDGYSDYLHPISETLLLGIGKDAVPALDSGDNFGGRGGAWYQGLKVALFDVSNPASPREVDSVVLGKRGTESEVLADHHAFSYLPPLGNTPARFSIPVRLHDRPADWTGFNPASPQSWWDYTHDALYSFEVSAQGISQAGRIIAETAEQRMNKEPLPSGRIAIPIDDLIAPYAWFGDRSVLKDDAVFYLHNGKVLGSLWGENKAP